jgi:hypothetical protein
MRLKKYSNTKTNKYSSTSSQKFGNNLLTNTQIQIQSNKEKNNKETHCQTKKKPTKKAIIYMPLVRT